MKKTFITMSAIMIIGIAVASVTNVIRAVVTAYPQDAESAGFPPASRTNFNGKVSVVGVAHVVTPSPVNAETTSVNGHIESRPTFTSTNMFWNSSTQRLEDRDIGVWVTPSSN